MNYQAVNHHNIYLSLSGTADSTAKPKTSPAVPAFIGSSGFFQVRDNIHFSFQVTAPYAKFYGLLRGLIEFHRPQDVSVSYNRDANTFEVRTNHLRHDFVYQFLNEIDRLLSIEIRFKSALKNVLEFERQYRHQRDSIYQSLLN